MVCGLPWKYLYFHPFSFFRTAVTAGEDEAVKFFNEWHQMIVSTVPAEKLLIYNVEDGWGPLVDFLGMEAPDEPFPDINDGVTITIIVLGGYYILVILVPALIIFCCWKKSQKFKNSLNRIFYFTLGMPLIKLQKICQRRKSPRSNNYVVKNNNNHEKDFNYINYSNLNSKV